MTELRPAACRCAAGGAGPLCAHRSGVRCSDPGCVLQTSGLTTRVGPAPQGELGGGERGGGRYSSCRRCKDEADRKEASVVKSAGRRGGRGAVPASGFLSCKTHWGTLYRCPLGTVVTPTTWLLLVATALFLFPTVCYSSQLRWVSGWGGSKEGPPGSAPRRLGKLVRHTSLPFLARGTLPSWGVPSQH